MGSVAVQHGGELCVAALQVQALAVLGDRLPQVELLLVLQPRLERLVALVLQLGKDPCSPLTGGRPRVCEPAAL